MRIYANTFLPKRFLCTLGMFVVVLIVGLAALHFGWPGWVGYVAAGFVLGYQVGEWVGHWAFRAPESPQPDVKTDA